MRYILALLPDPQDSLIYLAAAQEFSTLCDGYLLSEHSHPHATLASFSSQQALDELWASVQTWDTTSCPLRMLGLMLKKGQTPAHHYSVGITIARDPPLLDLHHQAINLLDRLGIAPLNPSLDLYQPHLTLAGIHWKPPSTLTLSSSLDALLARPMAPFRLALGRGDAIGQYLETLQST